LATVFLCACVKELPFPDKTFKKQLVINSIMVPFEPVKAFVSETQSPLAEGRFTPFPIATVKLLDEFGKLLDVLTFNPNTQAYEGSYSPLPGEKLRLEVDEEGNLYYAIAQDHIPIKKPLFTCDTSRVFYQGRQNFFQFDFILPDDPDDDSYYRLHCVREYMEYEFVSGTIDSVFKREVVDLATNDYWFIRNVNLQFSKRELLLTDDGFKGQVAFLKFGTFALADAKTNQKTVAIKLFLSSLSESHYSYARSLNEHLFYRTDPFSQSTAVFTNFTGALGVFGSYQVDSAVYLF
jgi:hypothetical protein